MEQSPTICDCLYAYMYARRDIVLQGVTETRFIIKNLTLRLIRGHLSYPNNILLFTFQFVYMYAYNGYNVI